MPRKNQVLRVKVNVLQMAYLESTLSPGTSTSSYNGPPVSLSMYPLTTETADRVHWDLRASIQKRSNCSLGSHLPALSPEHLNCLEKKSKAKNRGGLPNIRSTQNEQLY